LEMISMSTMARMEGDVMGLYRMGASLLEEEDVLSIWPQDVACDCVTEFWVEVVVAMVLVGTIATFSPIVRF